MEVSSRQSEFRGKATQDTAVGRSDEKAWMNLHREGELRPPLPHVSGPSAPADSLHSPPPALRRENPLLVGYPFFLFLSHTFFFLIIFSKRTLYSAKLNEKMSPLKDGMHKYSHSYARM